ncbi:MAG: hypothetical protein JOY93_08475 [Acidobacteriales bacterium]|nr:hypothetical protein [Terriglobales bacterium]
MDIESAIKRARHTIQVIRAQERATLRAVARFGRDVEDKARESFRRSIAKSEAELEKVLEERKKRENLASRKR